jgi:hypothetical protein
MRFWKPQLALAMAAAAVLALAVMLFDRRGVISVMLTGLFIAALVGMYLLRRYARAELVYLRYADTRPASRPEPEPIRDEATVDPGDRTGSEPSAVAGGRNRQRTMHS